MDIVLDDPLNLDPHETLIDKAKRGKVISKFDLKSGTLALYECAHEPTPAADGDVWHFASSDHQTVGERPKLGPFEYHLREPVS